MIIIRSRKSETTYRRTQSNEKGTLRNNSLGIDSVICFPTVYHDVANSPTHLVSQRHFLNIWVVNFVSFSYQYHKSRTAMGVFFFVLLLLIFLFSFLLGWSNELASFALQCANVGCSLPTIHKRVGRTGGQLFVRCWPHKPCPKEIPTTPAAHLHVGHCVYELPERLCLLCYEYTSIKYIGGSGCPDSFAFDLLLAGDGAEISQQKCRRWTSLADLSFWMATTILFQLRLSLTRKQSPIVIWLRTSPSAWANRLL